MNKKTFVEGLKKKLRDVRARQLSGESMNCPRCGLNTMERPTSKNPMSKYEDVRICKHCAEQEVGLEKMNVAPTPLWRWACLRPVKPDGDFTDTFGREAWKVVERDQIQTLLDILGRFFADEERFDSVARAEYEHELTEKCMGVDNVQLLIDMAWISYGVRDGLLTVTFIVTGGEILYRAGIESKIGPIEWLTA